MSLALNVNGDRLLRRLEALGMIGKSDSGGISRQAFTSADRQGREWLTTAMENAGLSVGIDSATNVIGCLAGIRPGSKIVIGSHIDTVKNGGKLDGAFGVLAGLEVLQTLLEHRVELHHTVEIVAFADEEGYVYPPGMLGSRGYAGLLDHSSFGRVGLNEDWLRNTLTSFGGNLEVLSSYHPRESDILAYLEIHVEQGPYLESKGKQIGIVDAITGRLTIDIEMVGEANHAGTTAMELRRDALAAAARAILLVEEIATDKQLVRVATVGGMDVEPNVRNIIPGVARLRVDIRDTTEAAMLSGLDELRESLNRIPLVSSTVHLVGSYLPAKTDQVVFEEIARAAADLDLEPIRMSSGAGHDAQILAGVAPAGLIFVPSIGGYSHVPEEDTNSDDLIAGANLLLASLLLVDQREDRAVGGRVRDQAGARR